MNLTKGRWSLTGYENFGEKGIVTKGAYKEPEKKRACAAEKLILEVASKKYWGGNESAYNPDKQTCALDLEIIKILRKKNKLSEIELRKKSGNSITTFNKALKGDNIYTMTAKRIAKALGVEMDEVLR